MIPQAARPVPSKNVSTTDLQHYQLLDARWDAVNWKRDDLSRFCRPFNSRNNKAAPGFTSQCGLPGVTSGLVRFKVFAADEPEQVFRA